MRIGLNARFLNYPQTGIGQHTIGILSALAKIDPENEYFLFVDRLPSPLPDFGPNFKIVVLPPSFRFLGSGVAKTTWEYLTIPHKATTLKLDLIHHLYPAVSVTKKRPVIMTVHDAIPWIFKDYQKALTSQIYLRGLNWSLPKAHHILTVSEAAKEDLVKTVKIPKSKINVIYNAYNSIYDKKIRLNEIKKILRQYGVSGDFIFYVGGFDVRKNVEKLLEAYLLVLKKYPKIKLVLGGGLTAPRTKLYASLKRAKSFIKRHKLDNKVKMVGFIAQKDLPAFYQGCQAFVWPSLYEGFGIPVLEAMASGTPVVTSKIPVFEEIAGRVVVLVDPKNPTDIANGITKILSNPKFAGELGAKGKMRAKSFSWEKSAKALLRLYKKIASKRR